MTRRSAATSAIAFEARRVFALLLVAAITFALSFSGRSYLFCAAIQQVVEKSCDTDDCSTCTDDDQGPRIGEGCCEEHQIGKIPPASTRVELPSIPPPPASIPLDDAARMAFVPRKQPQCPNAASRIVPLHARIRAGPSSAAERCIALRVFHC